MKHASRLDVERVAEVLAAQVLLAVNPLLKRIVELEARETAHIARIAALESRAPEKGDNASDEQVSVAVARYLEANPPEAGKDADPVTDQQIESAVAKRLETHPPKQGDPGKNAEPEQIAAAVAAYLKANPPEAGKDADPVTDQQIESAVAKRLETHPPKQGDPGKNAEPEQIAAAVAAYLKANPPEAGKDADPISADQIEAAVAKHLIAHPPQKGEDAKPINYEIVVKSVEDFLKKNPPEPGKAVKGDTGRGVKSAVINADGELVLSFTDGDLINVGRVKGKDGIDAKGEPGDDGFGFDDMTVEHEDGGRVVVYRFVCGERSKEFRCVTDTVLDRGVFKEGDTYERGDMVSWAGSGWVCQKETKAKPGDASSDWRLFVKKGRDGKDGVLKPPPTSAPLKLGGKE